MRVDLYGEMFRQESYYWWHVGKRELVKALLNNFPKKENQKILDVGCGTGMMMKELSFSGEVWGLDNDDSALAFCRKRGFTKLKKGSLEQKLPFENGSLTTILCLDVLEHLKDDEFSLKEFHRILKPGGILLITVPAYPGLWSRWDEVSGHCRRYLSGDLQDILIKTGFKPQKTSYYNLFILLPAILVRFLKSHLGKGEYASDFIELPGFLNRFLLFLAKIEKMIIMKTNLPAGLSLICLARK